MFQAIESEEFSPQKNELIRSLNSINEIISSAGVFKENYAKVINGFIPSINEQMKLYASVAKKAISCDIIDAVIDAIDFDKYKAWFSEKWNKKEDADVHPWNSLGVSNIIDAEIVEYDDEDVLNMQSVFPENETNPNPKELKKFFKYQKEAIEYENSFLKEFTRFENSLQKYREIVVQNMINNVDCLADAHYKEAIKISKHKKG